MKQINFEGDVSDSHWVHPKQTLKFNAKCPKCGEIAETFLDEDEYPNEQRTFYFDCEKCGDDFEHKYTYEKITYSISIPDEVTFVG